MARDLAALSGRRRQHGDFGNMRGAGPRSFGTMRGARPGSFGTMRGTVPAAPSTLWGLRRPSAPRRLNGCVRRRLDETMVHRGHLALHELLDGLQVWPLALIAE